MVRILKESGFLLKRCFQRIICYLQYRQIKFLGSRVAQLKERLLLTPEVHYSNPVIGKILYRTIFTVNV